MLHKRVSPTYTTLPCLSALLHFVAFPSELGWRRRRALWPDLDRMKVDKPPPFWGRGTSEVDWCEQNYEHSQYIAEYYNTLSNVLLVFIPLLNIYLARPFSKHISSDINVVWGLLTFVGVGSGYFHATLSYSGQLIDELAILWAMAACVPLAVPSSMLDNAVFQGSRTRLKIAVLAATVFSSLMMFVSPILNAFCLFFGSVPALSFIFNFAVSTKDWRCVRQIFISAFLWLLALTCWVNDRIFCQLWTQLLSIPYPQFHALWHILISIASYTGVIIGAYYVALKEKPELRPRLTIWPMDSLEIGVVYIGLTIPDPVNVMRPIVPSLDDASPKPIQPDPVTENGEVTISPPDPDADHLKKTE